MLATSKNSVLLLMKLKNKFVWYKTKTATVIGWRYFDNSPWIFKELKCANHSQWHKVTASSVTTLAPIHETISS